MARKTNVNFDFNQDKKCKTIIDVLWKEQIGFQIG